MALDTSDKLGDVSTNTDEWIEPYFTDVYSPWETKGQLEVGKEVKAQATTAKYCFATISSNQSLTTATETKILLNTYEWDAGMQGTNRIDITVAWPYSICSNIRYNSNATGLRFNTTTKNAWMAVSNAMPAISWNDTYVINSITEYLSVGDYIELLGYQDSGSTISVNANRTNTFLRVVQL